MTGFLPLQLAPRRSSSPSPRDSEASEALKIAEKELKTERERADSLAKYVFISQHLHSPGKLQMQIFLIRLSLCWCTQAA